MGRPSIIHGIKNPKKGLRFIRNQHDLEKGKKEFGNIAGYSRNIQGRNNIIDAQKKCNIPDNNDKRILKLRSDSVLPLGIPFNADLMKKIQSKYNNMIEDDEYSIIRSMHDGEVYSRQISYAHNTLPELSDLLNNEIIQLIEGYYKSHFQVKYLICWRNYHVPESVAKTVETFSDRWHCDEKPIDIFKLFVNLSDVTNDDGPFNIMTIPRTKKLIELGFENRFNYKLSDDIVEEDVIKATGSLGTAMLCNTELCLHRAGIPKEGHIRDIIQFQFVPSDKPLEKDWIKNVSLKPNEIKAENNPSVT